MARQLGRAGGASGWPRGRRVGSWAARRRVGAGPRGRRVRAWAARASASGLGRAGGASGLELRACGRVGAGRCAGGASGLGRAGGASGLGASDGAEWRRSVGAREAASERNGGVGAGPRFRRMRACRTTEGQQRPCPSTRFLTGRLEHGNAAIQPPAPRAAVGRTHVTVRLPHIWHEGCRVGAEWRVAGRAGSRARPRPSTYCTTKNPSTSTSGWPWVPSTAIRTVRDPLVDQRSPTRQPTDTRWRP